MHMSDRRGHEKTQVENAFRGRVRLGQCPCRLETWAVKREGLLGTTPGKGLWCWVRERGSVPAEVQERGEWRRPTRAMTQGEGLAEISKQKPRCREDASVGDSTEDEALGDILTVQADEGTLSSEGREKWRPRHWAR